MEVVRFLGPVHKMIITSRKLDARNAPVGYREMIANEPLLGSIDAQDFTEVLLRLLALFINIVSACARAGKRSEPR